MNQDKQDLAKETLDKAMKGILDAGQVEDIPARPNQGEPGTAVQNAVG